MARGRANQTGMYRSDLCFGFKGALLTIDRSKLQDHILLKLDERFTLMLFIVQFCKYADKHGL